jgi:hypothetical protein
LLLWWAAAKQFVEKSHTRAFLALRRDRVDRNDRRAGRPDVIQ